MEKYLIDMKKIYVRQRRLGKLIPYNTTGPLNVNFTMNTT